MIGEFYCSHVLHEPDTFLLWVNGCPLSCYFLNQGHRDRLSRSNSLRPCSTLQQWCWGSAGGPHLCEPRRWGQGKRPPCVPHQLLHPPPAPPLPARGTSAAPGRAHSSAARGHLLDDFRRSVVACPSCSAADGLSCCGGKPHATIRGQSEKEQAKRPLISPLFCPCAVSVSDRIQSVGRTFSLQLGLGGCGVVACHLHQSGIPAGQSSAASSRGKTCGRRQKCRSTGKQHVCTGGAERRCSVA